MRIKDSFIPIKNDKKIRKLHNEVAVEWLDDEGNVVDRIAHSNDVTPWIENVINKGNFCNQIPTAKLFPLLPWMQGICILDKVADATKMMIPSDANVIAVANNTSGSDSTDLRRGNFNPDASGEILDDDGRVIGYQNVWYWSDTRGNTGAEQAIKAVCLTRRAIAVSRYGDTMPDDTFLNEILNTFGTTQTLAICQIIDYYGETAYHVDLSGSNIVVSKYQLDTWEHSIFGTYNSNNQFDVTKLLGTATLTPTVAISSPNVARMSVSYADGKLHVLTWNGQALIDHEIDASDADPEEWTISSTAHTFVLGSGINIKSTDINLVAKDSILYSYDSVNDKYYVTLVGSNNKFYKCDLSNDANITEYNGATLANSNGVFVELGNGDWIKFSYGQDNVSFISVNYYHNGTVYLARDNYNSPAGWGTKYNAVNDTGYGVLLFSLARNGRYGDSHYVAIVAPVGSISTVFNDTTVPPREKHVGLTMRVVYRIVEETT